MYVVSVQTVSSSLFTHQCSLQPKVKAYWNDTSWVGLVSTSKVLAPPPIPLQRKTNTEGIGPTALYVHA